MARGMDPKRLQFYYKIRLGYDNYAVTTYKYVEGGPDRFGPEGRMKYQFVYLNVITVCYMFK